VLSRTDQWSSESTEEVISQVPTMYFSVSLNPHGPKSGSMSVETQRDAVNQGAELVPETCLTDVENKRRRRIVPIAVPGIRLGAIQ
jgi:hypothetical protein